MKCCIKCFTSNYLQNIISGDKTSIIGKCDFCKSSKISIIEAKDLIIYFRNLLDLYIPSDGITGVTGKPLAEQIISDFDKKIFSLDNPLIIENLLKDIFQDEFASYSHLFGPNVILEYKTNKATEAHAEVLKISWEKFVNEIKTENRFHLRNGIDLDLLETLLKRHSKEVNKGSIYFRGRISNKSGFKIDEMSNPPFNSAKPGRANPEGISYLYVANNLETTLYETRAALYDYVTIGEFELIENSKLVNLRETEFFDPIPLAEKEELGDFLIHLPFISTLQNELAKPIRRHDSELDYLPTQYVSEFIKSLDFDGVEYKSSLHPSGYNVAFLDPKSSNVLKLMFMKLRE